jgi:glycine/D-amino acid oxidase-like deaminating enzyme/nitrite reductase/ring-hydroxylating ferredoxin subunit/DMSO/TMAO reductase YedYZ heme-binding membrane subunit
MATNSGQAKNTPAKDSQSSRSPWFAKTPDQQRFAPLKDQHEADIVVVGAGIVGCMTAWRLAELGTDVVLLEANNVATGDTGFTTAFVTRIPDTDLPKLVERYGERFVERIFEANAEAQQYLRDLVAKQHIECDWQDCRSFIVSFSPKDPGLEQEWQVLQQVEPRSHRATPEELSAAVPPAKHGLVIEQEARFDPRAFLLGLLERAGAGSSSGKIRVHENSPVTSFQAERSHVIVKTEKGEIKADKVIFATGLPNPGLFELHDLFKPRQTFALLANYNQAGKGKPKLPISDDLVWDTSDPYYYLRQLNGQLMVGGADTKVGAGAGDPAVAHATLERFLDKRFPGKAAITNRWAGTLFYTSDVLPYAGEHPHYDGRVLVTCGFAGNGMVMGTAAALLLADLALERQTDKADLFAFARTGAKIAAPKPEPTTTATSAGSSAGTAPKSATILLAKILLPLIYLIALISPAIVFFTQRNGFGFISAAPDLKTLSLLMFPLVGLYAFTLVWAQVMLGSGMPLWRRAYPWIEKFHRAEGVFVLLFAGLHPSLIFFAYGMAYFGFPFVVSSHRIYAWMGEFQLTLIIVTVLTALLRKSKRLQKVWRYIHWANYVVFTSAWIHSWYLGSDVRTTPLRYLWIFFAASVAISFIFRVIRGVKNKRAAQAPAEQAGGGSGVGGSDRFIPVIEANKVPDQKPLCVTVEKQAIALYKIKDRFFATSNTCSHQGGPLCEGQLADGVIQCPWHGSRFDVKTGKVVAGPASRPVRVYQTRVRNGQVEIEL